MHESNLTKEKLTHPFWKKSIARTIGTAIAETDTTAWHANLVLDHGLAFVVSNEVNKPLQQVRVTANEVSSSMYQCRAVDEIHGEYVAKLEEFIESILVANGFLGSIEEGQLLASCSESARRW